MPAAFDVTALGNAIVDVISPADDTFLQAEGVAKGAMTLIDEAQAARLYGRMAPGVEASGGSAGNTVAGIASLGGRAAYIGKVADDVLGGVFAHDLRAGGVEFRTSPLVGGAATARCLVNVTPEGQRSMCTFLGASVALTPDDLDAELIKGAQVVYLEGYLFDAPAARRAFAEAAQIARAAGRRIALTLSDGFVVERHREGLLAFIDAEVDVVFSNAAEVTALFRTDDAETAGRRLAERVAVAAVTHGAAGSVVYGPGERVQVAAAPVAEVIDTTGAGDQYAAGVLFGLARGRPLEVCGRLGALAAAEVIGHYGPRPQTSLKQLAAKAGLLDAGTA